MKRTKEEAAITRSTLLKAALTVFSTKGYAGTSIEAITKTAKVTRGALYHHFESKADLYNTLLEEVSAKGATIVQQAVAEGGTFTEILKRVFTRQLAYIEDDKEAREIMELVLFKTGSHPELQTGRRKQIEAGQALIEGMARSFIAFQNGVIQMWLASPKSFSLKNSSEIFADVLIAGLRSKA